MKYFFLVIGIIAASACQNKRSHLPCDTTFVGIPQDTSYLSTPLIIPMQLIEDKINVALKQDILNDDDFESHNRDGKDDKLKLKISRLGNIHVVWKDNAAKYKVPLLVLLERQIISKRMLHLPKSLALKTEFSLLLVFKTSLDINPDWGLAAKTQFISFSWLSPVKAFYGIVDIRKIVERQMLRKMPEILGNMDSAICANVHIDRQIKKVWQNIQKPIPLNRNDALVWLKIKPIQFEMGTISTENNEILIQSRLSATTETIVGKDPAYSIDSILPPLLKRRNLPDEAFVSVLTEIPYDDISALLNRKIKGQTFDLSGKKIKIKKAEVWGCGTDLVLHLSILGDATGDIYFKGMPVYERDSQRIVVHNFDFEVETESFLLGGTDWLLHQHFKEQIQALLSVELSAKIAATPAAISDGIERGKSGDKMDFTIEQWDFKPQKICVRDRDLAMIILINAKAKVRLTKI